MKQEFICNMDEFKEALLNVSEIGAAITKVHTHLGIVKYEIERNDNRIKELYEKYNSNETS